MKLKSLAVITLLILGCSSAFAGTFSLGFMDYSGSTTFCDYETVTTHSPYAGGVHNFSVCGLAANGAMVGFFMNIPRSNNAPVKGNVLALADNSFDAQYQFYTGCQIDWVTKLKPNNPNFGWSFYFTCGGGGDYLGNFGFLTTTLGSPQVGAKPSFGTAVTAKAKIKQ